MANPLVIRTLYRSLLRAAKPFSSPSPNAVVLSCLLHRTGIDDAGLEWDPSPPVTEVTEKTKGPRQPRSVDEARDLSLSYADVEEDDMPGTPSEARRRAPNHILFRRLLREVVTGTGGFRQMQFPSEMDTTRLKQVIRREFRSTSSKFSDSTRQQVAFLALRELNKKLSWADCLSKGIKEKDPESILDRNRRQAARHVSSLPIDDPASYLKAGTYLVAHPLLRGFFRRTVICILDHTDCASTSRTGGTYGLIVNRIATNPSSGRRRTLKEVLRTLPPELMQAFGNCSVREGGPVHMSLQMIHARTPDQPALGGTVLSAPTENETTSTALDSDRAVYYRGNMMDAAIAVINGALDRDDVSFYVGASCWDLGQLESEIERGFFIPCRGPPYIALTGVCERVGDDENDMKRPKADLWLSMMCAMGEDEANLAHLLSNDDDCSDFGDACDLL